MSDTITDALRYSWATIADANMARKLIGENKRLRAALAFYANPAQWNDTKMRESSARDDVLQIGHGCGWEIAQEAIRRG